MRSKEGRELGVVVVALWAIAVSRSFLVLMDEREGQVGRQEG